MNRLRQSLSALLVIAASASAASGQVTPSAVGAGPVMDGRPPSVNRDTQQAAAGHTHKLAGFGAGVTISAIVLTLDEVVGSSCRGSGPYLRNCRVGFVAAALLGGGLGTLVAMRVKTDQPPGRATRVMVGSAIGVGGAFLASTLGCHQEDPSNPTYLCGDDGMLSASAAATGAVVGGVLGALLGNRDGGLELSRLGLVPRLGDQMGVIAAFTLRAP